MTFLALGSAGTVLGGTVLGGTVLGGTGLAGSPANSSTLTDVEPGLLGFLVVAALGVALVFLLRSMNKQFRKIGPRPEEPESVAADEADAVAGEAVTPTGAAYIAEIKSGTDKSGTAGADIAEPDTGVGFVPDTGGPRR